MVRKRAGEALVVLLWIAGAIVALSIFGAVMSAASEGRRTDTCQYVEGYGCTYDPGDMEEPWEPRGR